MLTPHSLTSAAKTALLLDNTQLGPSQVHVSSAASLDQIASSTSKSAEGQEDDGDITQEDKPRSRIVAEYLAHGYALSDHAITQAIALDQKHGVSQRFTNALAAFDSKYKATDKAKGIDSSYRITEKAQTGYQALTSYFEKAIGTPTGQKLAAFYTKSNKQVVDIHNEARRLADLKKQQAGGSSSSGIGTGQSTEANEKTMESTPGDSKATESGVKGEHTATGSADTIAQSTGMQPLGEKS